MSKVKPGQKYGRLTIIEDSGERRHRQIMWLCQCDCGNTTLVHSASLTRGLTKSCGCLATEINKKRRVDLVGQRFGRLIVTAPAPNQKWVCKCDCGNTITTYTANLTMGRTQSCGCLRTERIAALEKERQMGRDIKKSMSVDGTNIAHIRNTQKVSRNSSTGVRGVCLAKNGQYRAYIVLNRKQISLGLHDTLEQAAIARKEAEKELYKPIIEAWKKEKIRKSGDKPR